MAAARPQKTLADYVVIAISPALIMVLIGSLAYFLLEVTYDGRYAGRIRWVLFWFVFASVLVGRIAIEQGRQYASAYWVAVGLAGAAVAFRLLETYRLGALVLLAVIMWCANKLTWDCTLIDDSQDASGEGLLKVSGFDDAGGQETSERAASDQRAAGRGKDTDPPLTAPDSPRPPVPFWKRVLLNRAEREDQPHAPGLWVVYFSLAALPLFGVGQLFIPAENVESRDWGFKLLLVYVAAALGLLLTTSFLGLRRYLRQRKLKMPGRMTASWLATGTLLAAVLLAACLLLPRPGSTTTIDDVFDKVASKARDASKFAFLKDDAGENEGTRTGKPADEQDQAEQNQDTGGQAGRGGKQAGQSDDREKPAERDGQSDSQGQKQGAGQAQGKGGSGSSGRSKDSNDSKSRQSNQGRKQSGQDEREQNSDRDQQQRGGDQQQQQQAAGGGRQRERQEQQQGRTGGSGDQSQSQSSQSSSTPSESVPQTAEWIGRLVKIILYVVLAAVALYFIVRNWRSIVETLARMWAELRDLFASLFGGRGSQPASAGAGGQDLLAPSPPRPFASFDNPFFTGAAGRMSPEELVIYTFRALEAWGSDQGQQRRADQTPLEYAAALSGQFPEVAGAARQASRLFTRVAYAERAPTDRVRETLEPVWRTLTDTAESSRRWLDRTG